MQYLTNLSLSKDFQQIVGPHPEPFLLTTMGDLEQNHCFCYRGWTTSTGHCSTIFMGGNFSMAPVTSCVVYVICVSFRDNGMTI